MSERPDGLLLLGQGRIHVRPRSRDHDVPFWQDDYEQVVYSADGEVMVYKFSRKMCRHCPRAKDCIGDTDYMSASVSVYHEELKAAAAYSETEAFRLDKAVRGRIEAIYRGLQKVDLQLRLTVIALNTKRIVTLLQEPKASALAEPKVA